MQNFRDEDAVIGFIVFQGAREAEIDSVCDAEMRDAIAGWCDRSQPTRPQPELLHVESTRSFVITYQGDSSEYWPSKKENQIGEALVRDFLFHDGICTLNDLKPRYYRTIYRVEALEEIEHLVVLPYPTESENIAGVVVVCVNKHVT